MPRESATLPNFTPTPPSMDASAATHLLLIPSFNAGERVYETVRAARREWMPVWVVVDGSDDGTAEGLRGMAQEDPGLRVIVLPENRGKGAAVLHGIELAAAHGFSHVLTLNSEGRHPASLIPEFIAASCVRPEAMILGVPVFGAGLQSCGTPGRKLANWWVNLETLWTGIGDSLFGFRVYPIAPLIRVMHGQRWMRRFDFDPEAVVRMAWDGVPLMNLPVRLARSREGARARRFADGQRDRLLLAWMHVRLFFGFLWRLPRLLARRVRAARTRKPS